MIFLTNTRSKSINDDSEMIVIQYRTYTQKNNDMWDSLGINLIHELMSTIHDVIIFLISILSK